MTWHSEKEGEKFQTDVILTRKRYYLGAWSESSPKAYTLVLTLPPWGILTIVVSQ